MRNLKISLSPEELSFRPESLMWQRTYGIRHVRLTKGLVPSLMSLKLALWLQCELQAGSFKLSVPLPQVTEGFRPWLSHALLTLLLLQAAMYESATGLQDWEVFSGTSFYSFKA